MILLRPLDLARIRLLHALGPVSRVLVANREKRVAVGASLAVVAAFALAAIAPLWALALGPLIFGVPHVVADVRYLVIRTGLARDRWVLAAIGAPLLVAAFGGGLRAGTIAVAAALLAVRGSQRRAVLGLVLLAPVAFVAWQSPAQADAAFAHLHNLVAVIVWWAFRRPGERAGWRWAAIVAIAFAVLLILTGTLPANLSSEPAGFDGESIGWTLALGFGAPWGERMLVLYVFGQSIHYAVWLRFVPDEDRARATPRSFSASWAALGEDLGPTVIAAFVVALVFVGWGLFDVRAARDSYLRGAAFHGHLELVALAYALARGRLRA